MTLADPDAQSQGGKSRPLEIDQGGESRPLEQWFGDCLEPLLGRSPNPPTLKFRYVSSQISATLFSSYAKSVFYKFEKKYTARNPEMASRASGASDAQERQWTSFTLWVYCLKNKKNKFHILNLKHSFDRCIFWLILIKQSSAVTSQMRVLQLGDCSSMLFCRLHNHVWRNNANVICNLMIFVEVFMKNEYRYNFFRPKIIAKVLKKYMVRWHETSPFAISLW